MIINKFLFGLVFIYLFILMYVKLIWLRSAPERTLLGSLLSYIVIH